VCIEGSEILYPLTGRGLPVAPSSFDQEKHQELTQKAYAVHHWFNTWTDRAYFYKTTELGKIHLYQGGAPVLATKMEALREEEPDQTT